MVAADVGTEKETCDGTQVLADGESEGGRGHFLGALASAPFPLYSILCVALLEEDVARFSYVGVSQGP